MIIFHVWPITSPQIYTVYELNRISLRGGRWGIFLMPSVTLTDSKAQSGDKKKKETDDKTSKS